MSYLKGDIYYADLNNSIGDVQNGIRPVMVISNNFYNNFSNCVTVVPFINECGLSKPSKIMCENITTISKKQLRQRIGHMPIELKSEVDKAIKIQLAM